MNHILRTAVAVAKAALRTELTESVSSRDCQGNDETKALEDSESSSSSFGDDRDTHDGDDVRYSENLDRCEQRREKQQQAHSSIEHDYRNRDLSRYSSNQYYERDRRRQVREESAVAAIARIRAMATGRIDFSRHTRQELGRHWVNQGSEAEKPAYSESKRAGVKQFRGLREGRTGRVAKSVLEKRKSVDVRYPSAKLRPSPPPPPVNRIHPAPRHRRVRTTCEVRSNHKHNKYSLVRDRPRTRDDNFLHSADPSREGMPKRWSPFTDIRNKRWLLSSAW